MHWRLSWRKWSIVFGLCVVLFWTETRAQEPHPPHWSYAGKDGPENWGRLDRAYATCAFGHAQSPIDIEQAKLADLPPLKFDYSSVPLNIINNGHTIQVNYAPGSMLTVADKTYTLKQFHFHHPSEEYIKGRSSELVAHLVHDDGSGHLAVVAVLFEIGSPNATLDSIWRHIPIQSEKATDVPSVSLNAKDLLPVDHGYYTFSGSLTTPPCSEGVTWYVLRNRSTLSEGELETFAKLYPQDARPIQPLYGRAVLETK